MSGENIELDLKKAMMDEIMIVVKANNLPVTGEFFFFLAFRSISELKKICQELHIKIPKVAP